MDVLKLQTWVDAFESDELIVDKVKEYLDFIVEARDRYDPSRYSEWHHVMPKCIDPDKKFRDQGVQINGRDHVLAHQMLVECFTHCEKRKKLGYALHMMLRDPLCQRLESITPGEYEEIRRQWSKSVTGFKRPPETGAKISHTLSDGRLKGENHPLYSKHHTDETKRKISESNKDVWTDDKKREFSRRRSGEGNPCFGKHITRSVPFSEESRKKMSLSGKGKIWINNGVVSTKIVQGQSIPEGWSRGRAHFDHNTSTCLGKVWINNGEINKKIDKSLSLPEGFVLGRLCKSRED